MTIMANNLKTYLQSAFLSALLIGSMTAMADENFPGQEPDRRILKTQEKADSLFEKTDYKRALFIYREELAPRGDKFAQYMIGYMYLTGKGVDEDWVLASVWYRLAAERGVEQFVAASNRHWHDLEASQQSRSDELFVQLRKQYGDVVLVMKAARADYDLLRSRTGSRLSNNISPLTVIDVNNTAPESGSEYHGRIEKRLRARLDFVTSHTAIEINVDNPGRVNMESLERQVDEHLDKLD